MEKNGTKQDMACLSVFVLTIALILTSIFLGAYFWIPLWYGWFSLVIGIVFTWLAGLFAYHACLSIAQQNLMPDVIPMLPCSENSKIPLKPCQSVMASGNVLNLL